MIRDQIQDHLNRRLLRRRRSHFPKTAGRCSSKRYLRRGLDGKPIETIEGMFRRVARAVAEPDTDYGYDAESTEDSFLRAAFRRSVLPQLADIHRRRHAAGPARRLLRAADHRRYGPRLRRYFPDAARCRADSADGRRQRLLLLAPAPERRRTWRRARARRPARSDSCVCMTRRSARSRRAARGAARTWPCCASITRTSKISSPARRRKIRSPTSTSRLASPTSSWQAVEDDNDFELVNPRDRQGLATVRAREVFDTIVTNAHRNGEPGVLFLDAANRQNPVPHLYELEATNPCGEQWLGPYENCCLGSINLAQHVHVDDGAGGLGETAENDRRVHPLPR